MSKANKKKEVKEEIKAPSAEVSENGAEVETEAGQEEVVANEITHVLLVRDFKEVLRAIPGGNREVDLAVEDSMKLLDNLKGLMVFIDKAISEKKK